jgi:hypothetical protein
MGLIDTIRDSMGGEWLPSIYRDKIRTQRTRLIALEIPSRRNSAVIQYTLLGIELKVGKHRFACPDLATARYMRVFARVGIREFAVPYDITKISVAADDLETSWHGAVLALNDNLGSRALSERKRQQTMLATVIRHEIIEIGGGEAMPVFDRETRARKY